MVDANKLSVSRVLATISAAGKYIFRPMSIAGPILVTFLVTSIPSVFGKRLCVMLFLRIDAVLKAGELFNLPKFLKGPTFLLFRLVTALWKSTFSTPSPYFTFRKCPIKSQAENNLKYKVSE